MNETIESLELISTFSSTGELVLKLDRRIIPEPAEDEVIVRVEAAPIDPSDIATLNGPADIHQGRNIEGDGGRYVAPLLPGSERHLAGRIDKPERMGNEWAGTVVKAGSGALAQSLLNETVSAVGRTVFPVSKTKGQPVPSLERRNLRKRGHLTL